MATNNVTGNGTNYIRIKKTDVIYWILYYATEINAGGWKFECTGTNCTNDYGNISSVYKVGGGTNDLLLYIKDEDGNTLYGEGSHDL